VEDLVKAGDGEDLQRGAVVRDERYLPANLVELLLGLDQDAEAAGVDEPHVPEVHEDPPGTALDELAELVPERRSRRQVDLTADIQDRPVGLRPCIESEFDGAFPLSPRDKRSAPEARLV